MSELKNAIDALLKKNIMSLEQIKKNIEDSLIASYKNRYGEKAKTKVIFKDDLSDVNLFEIKKIVDTNENIDNDVDKISLTKAKELDQNAEDGDTMLLSVPLGLFDQGSLSLEDFDWTKSLRVGLIKSNFNPNPEIHSFNEIQCALLKSSGYFFWLNLIITQRQNNK